MVVVSTGIGDDVSITSEHDQDCMTEKFTTRSIRVGNSETKATLGINWRPILDFLNPRKVWYVTTKRKRTHTFKDKGTHAFKDKGTYVFRDKGIPILAKCRFCRLHFRKTGDRTVFWGNPDSTINSRDEK